MPDAPTTVLWVGDVLREWRDAERALDGLPAGNPALAQTLAEIELRCRQCQALFRATEPNADP